MNVTIDKAMLVKWILLYFRTLRETLDEKNKKIKL